MFGAALVTRHYFISYGPVIYHAPFDLDQIVSSVIVESAVFRTQMYTTAFSSKYYSADGSDAHSDSVPEETW